MNTLSYKTISANSATVNKEWVVVNADGISLGRLASKVAVLIRGKHKTNFTPHVDCGDNVIVLNAEKVQLTGSKADQKEYIWHTGYPGGQKTTTVGEVMKENPVKVVERAIKGMLPKNRLGSVLYSNLHVYAGADHKHEGQQPKEINIKRVNDNNFNLFTVFILRFFLFIYYLRGNN